MPFYLGLSSLIPIVISQKGLHVFGLLALGQRRQYTVISVVNEFENALVGHIMVEINRNPMAVIHMIARTHGIELFLQLCGNLWRGLEITEVEHLDIDKTKLYVVK